jgi:hypothetical protein
MGARRFEPPGLKYFLVVPGVYGPNVGHRTTYGPPETRQELNPHGIGPAPVAPSSSASGGRKTFCSKYDVHL